MLTNLIVGITGFIIGFALGYAIKTYLDIIIDGDPEDDNE